MTDERASRVMLELDWAAAYNDLHYLLVLERFAWGLGLRPCITALLVDLYGRPGVFVPERNA